MAATDRKNTIVSFMKRVESELGTTFSVDWPHLDFNSSAHAEWIEPRCLGFSVVATRNGERHELWTFNVNCYARTGEEGGKSMWRAWGIADLVEQAFGQHDLGVRNWAADGDPIVSYLRFGPASVVPVPGTGLSPKATADLAQVNVTLQGMLIE